MSKRTSLEETIQEPGYQSGGESISGRPSRVVAQSYKRRRYLPVFLEGFGRAILEESELHNNPNGDAGITNSGRLFRVALKGLAYGVRQNSINLSNTPGAQWRALGPMDILLDQGGCLVDCPPGQTENCCEDPIWERLSQVPYAPSRTAQQRNTGNRL